MSTTKQAPLDHVPADATAMVRIPSDESEVLHALLAETDPDAAGETHGLPACDPSAAGDVVVGDPDALSDAATCDSPACFGGER